MTCSDWKWLLVNSRPRPLVVRRGGSMAALLVERLHLATPLRTKVDSACWWDRKFCPRPIRPGLKHEKNIWPSSQAAAGLKDVNGRNPGRRWTFIDFEAETKRTRVPIGGRCQRHCVGPDGWMDGRLALSTCLHDGSRSDNQ